MSRFAFSVLVLNSVNNNIIMLSTSVWVVICFRGGPNPRPAFNITGIQRINKNTMMQSFLEGEKRTQDDPRPLPTCTKLRHVFLKHSVLKIKKLSAMLKKLTVPSISTSDVSSDLLESTRISLRSSTNDLTKFVESNQSTTI